MNCSLRLGPRCGLCRSEGQRSPTWPHNHLRVSYTIPAFANHHSDGCAPCTSTPFSSTCWASNTPTSCKYLILTTPFRLMDGMVYLWRKIWLSGLSIPSSSRSADGGKLMTERTTSTLTKARRLVSARSWIRQYRLATCCSPNQHTPLAPILTTCMEASSPLKSHGLQSQPSLLLPL